jgi:hypothetical protein
MDNWKYVTTNYREAWISYRKSQSYNCEALMKSGIKQKYASNILHSAFAAGWNAKPGKTKIIK